jgi:hypothetical protein
LQEILLSCRVGVLRDVDYNIVVYRSNIGLKFQNEAKI